MAGELILLVGLVAFVAVNAGLCAGRAVGLFLNRKSQMGHRQ